MMANITCKTTMVEMVDDRRVIVRTGNNLLGMIFMYFGRPKTTIRTTNPLIG
ncbi:hypothetical protein [Lentibacillus kapialis]|uniref:hypothetical protein n=1 Tax=Lentibacillus kapialis TaxID=340214 RepID=UPI001669B098|nr:hypothetical protein [Lentibacillus kapialis]